MSAVIVLLAGLTCDGKCYQEGAVENAPGPELLALAEPGVKHWTGKRAARLHDGEGSAVESASPQSRSHRHVDAPPGSVVILLEGLTADGKCYRYHEVVPSPGPQLLEHTEPGARHWSNGQKAAVLIKAPKTPRPKREQVVSKMEPSPDVNKLSDALGKLVGIEVTGDPIPVKDSKSEPLLPEGKDSF